MEDHVWKFARAAQRLEICRQNTDAALQLVVTTDGEPKAYRFDDATRLLHFQSDMESMLLKTGWSFVEFSPDRRSGAERRQWPRLNERRRWWTDGLRGALPGQWFKSG